MKKARRTVRGLPRVQVTIVEMENTENWCRAECPWCGIESFFVLKQVNDAKFGLLHQCGLCEKPYYAVKPVPNGCRRVI